MFQNCETDSACHTAFPNLRNEFHQVMERLALGNVHVSLLGHTDLVPLDRWRVAEGFRSKLYRPDEAVALPWIIHRACAGDCAPIGILSSARKFGKDFSLGLFFSITCSEDIPFVREQDVVRERSALS